MLQLLMLMGLLAIAGWLVWSFSPRLRTARALRRTEQLSDDQVCWTCGSTRLQSSSPDCHRCLACGALQGEGAGAQRDGERRKRILALPGAERRTLGLQLLAEAKLTLLAAEGELDNVHRLSVKDMLNLEKDAGEHKQSLFAGVLASVGRAEQQLADATVALSGAERFERLDVNLGSAAWVLDALDVRLPFSVTSLGEGSIHQEIGRSRRHVAQLTGVAERLEARSSPADPTGLSPR
jgi:hypothetical protein